MFFHLAVGPKHSDLHARNLRPGLFQGTLLFIVRTVAFLGASADRAKFGNKAVRAFQQQGYTVYPVNPKEKQIEGLQVYPSISSLPVRPQMVSVYLPPQILLGILAEISAKGCDELWLNPGTESDKVLAEAERLGLNVIQACSIVGLGISPVKLGD